MTNIPDGVLKGKCPVCGHWITLVSGYIVNHSETPDGPYCKGSLKGATLIKGSEAEEKITSAKELFQHWMKTLGPRIGDHEQEVVEDVQNYERWLTSCLHMEIELEETIRREAYAKGFAAARDKAAGIAYNFGVDERTDTTPHMIASRIEAMEPDK